jgi:hypothetical protein
MNDMKLLWSIVGSDGQVKTYEQGSQAIKHCPDCNLPYDFHVCRQREVDALEARIKKLEQDNDDMRDSLCTRFVRCPKCERLGDDGYICQSCGWDYGDE